MHKASNYATLLHNKWLVTLSSPLHKNHRVNFVTQPSILYYPVLQTLYYGLSCICIYHLTSIAHYIRSKQNVMTNKLKLSLVSEPKIRHTQTAKLHQIYHKVIMRSWGTP